MNRNKILSLILSCVMFVGLISAGPVSVHASEINSPEVIQPFDNLSENNNGTQENNNESQEVKVRSKRGIKGKIAKGALKGAAKVFRSGGLKNVLNSLKHVGFNSKSITNMIKYSDEIADVLDDLSTWSDVVEKTIYDQLVGALGGGSVARDIAWWVSKIISWGLL